MSGAWGQLVAASLLAGCAWWAGWAAFARAARAIVSELRAEVAAEREARQAMLGQCLGAMADQRSDGIEAVGRLAQSVQELAAAVRDSHRGAAAA